MTTPTPGRTWVQDAPPIEPLRYGLFSVASFTQGSGTWQIRGVEYFTDACTQGGYVVGSCPAPVPGTDLSYTFSFTPGTGDAFSVYSDPGNPAPPVAYALSQGGTTVAQGQLAAGVEADLSAPAGDYEIAFTLNGTTSTQPLTLPLADVFNVIETFPSGATTHDKPTAEGLTLAEGSDPFTVYARAECNAVAFDDPQGVATRRLGLIEQREAERYFSRYVLATAQQAGNTALPLLDAIGVLEQHAALNYAGTPTLHAPRWTNPHFNAVRALQSPADTGQVLRTHLDARVAFGAGYWDNPFDPETPPGAGQFWLVATGSVRGWRSEAFVNETFTPATNTRMAIAERTYALDADCYLTAVLVDTTGGA